MRQDSKCGVHVRTDAEPLVSQQLDLALLLRMGFNGIFPDRATMPGTVLAPFDVIATFAMQLRAASRLGRSQA